MHYLIDGHNLIAHLADIDLEDPNDEVKLVLMMRGWAAAGRKRRVTLYFDGGLPGGKSPDLSSGPVQVIFASSRRTADSLIMQHIARVKHPPDYTLVTGDQEIIAVARQRRMPAVTSEVFARQLEKEKEARQQAARPDEGTEPKVSEQEIDHWLALFGPEPEIPPAKPRSRQPDTSLRSNELTPRNVPPPKPRPRPANEQRRSGTLTADEVAEWLSLFGGEPEPKAAPPRRKKGQPADPAQTGNKTGGLVSDEELDEWFRLFGPGAEE